MATAGTTFGASQRDETVQAVVPDPSKSKVTSEMTGTLTFLKSGGASTTTITGWFAMLVVCAAASTYYYNDESTKTMTIPAGVPTIIFVAQENVTSVSIVFGAGTNYVQGM